jgi:hypothetical protein
MNLVWMGSNSLSPQFGSLSSAGGVLKVKQPFKENLNYSAKCDLLCCTKPSELFFSTCFTINCYN